METFYNIKKQIKVVASDSRIPDTTFEYVPERKSILGAIIPEHFKYLYSFTESNLTTEEILENTSICGLMTKRRRSATSISSP